MKPYSVLLLSFLVVAGCKAKQAGLAPHERQQLEQQEKALAKKKIKQTKQSPEKGKNPEEPSSPELSWPMEVQDAYFRLYKARFDEMPNIAQELALLGLPAALAMRAIVSNKRVAQKKIAFVSLLLVQLHSFRPSDLISMLKEKNLPFVQRAAIQMLSLIGNPQCVEALQKMKFSLNMANKQGSTPSPSGKPEEEAAREHQGHEHGTHAPEDQAVDPEESKNPYGPLEQFIEEGLSRRETWNYSDSQLQLLDRIFQAQTPAEVKQHLDELKDNSLESGLIYMMLIPAIRPLIYAAVVHKMIMTNANNEKKLREYCEPGFPGFLRLYAARQLLTLSESRNGPYLKKLSDNQQDPLASRLRDLLVGKELPIPLPPATGQSQ